MVNDRVSYSFSHKKHQSLSEKMQQALASLSLEGIKLPPDSLEDIRQLDSGEISKEQFLQKTLLIANA